MCKSALAIIIALSKMGLQVSNTSPGWPRPELPDPVFQPILARIVHTGSSNVTPDEAETGTPTDLGTPRATPGYENSGDVIDTSSFTEADIDPTECEEPPYEPVYPPSDGEPPEYGDLPPGWNPPEEIPDNRPEPQTIQITVTADSQRVCLLNGDPIIISLTQTVTPPQYADLFDPPTSNYDGSVGRYVITPGQFHEPVDANTYIVTSHDGELVVAYCYDNDYNLFCDVQLVADGYQSSDKFYRTEATFVKLYYQQGTNIPEYTYIHSYLAFALRLEALNGASEGEEKGFTIRAYEDSNGSWILIPDESHYVIANTYSVTSGYLMYCEFAINDTDKLAIEQAFATGGTWSKSKRFKIEIEGDDGRIISLTRSYIIKSCPCGQVGCNDQWIVENNPSILWAGTAEPGTPQTP